MAQPADGEGTEGRTGVPSLSGLEHKKASWLDTAGV